jgi:hypothetical protein
MAPTITKAGAKTPLTPPIESMGEDIDSMLVSGGITCVLRAGAEIKNMQSISGSLAVKLVGNEFKT